MHRILYRPIIVLSFVFVTLVVVEFLALGSITWWNLKRIDRIKQDIVQGHDLEELVFDLINSPKLYQRDKTDRDFEKSELHKKIVRFTSTRHAEQNGTGALLDKIKVLLQSIEKGKRQDIAELLSESKKILDLQRSDEQQLLADVYQNSRLEVNFAVVTPLAILLPSALLGLFYFRRHVLSPLIALDQLLKRLTKGEMQPIQYDASSLLLQPLFISYNRLINRLSELEEEHRTYTENLQREIRHAAHALLEQSYSLARSERLAAVGELAASAAHELRNPLAGIQAALENMRKESEDADFRERLQMVGLEVKRLIQQLNDLLAYSKHEPDDVKVTDVSKLVDDLLTLLKYQVNDNIRLIYSVTPGLRFTLPETEFRQALLNLLLNSIQELGKPGGTIQLHIDHRDARLEVEVSDSGKGFPKELLEQGVRPFVSYHETGTGLGLSMVSRFARSLGGQLLLNNDSLGHACAKLIIPAVS